MQQLIDTFKAIGRALIDMLRPIWRPGGGGDKK